MSKKSSSNRQRPASQAKSGATSKASARQMNAATLVRASGPNSVALDSTTSASGAKPQSSPSAASIVRDTPAAPAKSTTKPATPPKAASSVTPAKSLSPAAKPTPAAKAPAPVTGKRQDTRVARARATQRARQAGQITAESYAYVLGDLKLVAVLAVGAFAILIALTFFLPR